MVSTINATSSSGIVSTADNSMTLGLQTNGTTALYVDASQNVGIGTSSPISGAGLGRLLQIYNSGTTATIQLQDSTTGSASANGLQLQTSGGLGYVWNLQTAALVFGTANTERARIDSSGNLLVGTTTAASGYKISVGNGSSAAGIYGNSNGSGVVYAGTDTVNNSSAGFQIGHITTTNACQVRTGSSGGVTLTSGATSWTSLSDARLKNVNGSFNNALIDIAQIQAVKFTWKNDTSNKPCVGVIAQSVQNVVPEAVEEIKLAKDDETDYLSVKYTELIPVMIAAIQELSAKVDAQAARIAELEAKP
jgi:hypothetical protein